MAQSDEAALSLADLKPGQQGRVQSIAGDDGTLRRRLQALGIVKGAEVLVELTAPMGDPRTYTLHGYRLALRKAEACHVMVALD